MNLQAKFAMFGTGIAVLAVLLVTVISSFSTRITVAKLLVNDERETAQATMNAVEQWHIGNGSWQHADRIFERIAGTAHQAILLVDDNNRCVTSYPSDFCNRLVSIGPGSKLIIQADDGGRAHLNKLLGVPKRIVTGDERDGTMWTLYVLPSANVPNGTFSRLTSSMTRSLWIGGAVGSLFALAISVLLSRRILRPIRELVTAVNALKRGDFASRTTIRSYDEIGSLGTAFNSMAKDLERHKRARDELFHDVAHELRTPLTNIRCQVESLQDGLATFGATTLASLHEETMLLTRLVDDLRDIALAEAGQLHLEMKDCDLGVELRRVILTSEPAANTRCVQLALVTGSSMLVRADPDRLTQMLHNLLSNAIHHSPGGSVVTMRSRSDYPMAVIEVEDNGPGIPAEHLPFVFDRFYRADPVRSCKNDGAGLGLAIVQQLAKLQGGAVEVKNVNDHGCCFALTLPLVEFLPQAATQLPTENLL